MQAAEPPQGHAPFQIDDEVYLELHQADEGGGSAALGGTLCHDLLQLREISHHASHLLATIRKQQPEVGHYLSLLDRKIELLAQMVAGLGMGEGVAETQRVSLGPEGMHFEGPVMLSTNTPLRLRMILLPSHLCLQLAARVVGCEAQPSGSYRIELRFENIGELQQDALIRHLLERQSAALRQQRDS